MYRYSRRWEVFGKMKSLSFFLESYCYYQKGDYSRSLNCSFCFSFFLIWFIFSIPHDGFSVSLLCPSNWGAYKYFWGTLLVRACPGDVERERKPV